MVLQVYEVVTGIRLNMDKSTIINIGDDKKIQVLAKIMNCKVRKITIQIFENATWVFLKTNFHMGCNSREVPRQISNMEKEVSLKN